MEMLSILMLNANRHKNATSVTVVVEKPIRASASANTIKATESGFLLSNFETSHPDTGRLIMELMGIKRRMVPSSASLYAKLIFMVGIRDVHVEKQKPERKKKIPSAALCFDFNSIPAAKFLTISFDVMKRWGRSYFGKLRSFKVYSSQSKYSSFSSSSSFCFFMPLFLKALFNSDTSCFRSFAIFFFTASVSYMTR